MRRVLLSAASFALLAGPLAAQAAKRPADFKVRYDEPGPDSTTLVFVTMAPGWHVTTGPSVILWNPATTAKGNFKAETTINLFKPGGGHAEGFGIFVGGTNLEAASEGYTYFLVRNDGKYLIKQRVGADTKDVVPWTASPAIKLFDGSATSVGNTLTVVAGATNVDFLINGTKVASQPRAAIAIDGVVGLRVNHMLNVHVASLAVTPG